MHWCMIFVRKNVDWSIEMSEVIEESCEYGYEGCNEDDPETWCEEHLLEAGERHAEGMQETYDF